MNQAVTGMVATLPVLMCVLIPRLALGIDSYGGSPSVAQMEALFTAFGGGSTIDMASEAFVAGADRQS